MSGHLLDLTSTSATVMGAGLPDLGRPKLGRLGALLTRWGCVEWTPSVVSSPVGLTTESTEYLGAGEARTSFIAGIGGIPIVSYVLRSGASIAQRDVTPLRWVHVHTRSLNTVGNRFSAVSVHSPRNLLRAGV